MGCSRGNSLRLLTSVLSRQFLKPAIMFVLTVQFLSTLNTVKTEVSPGHAIWTKFFSEILADLGVLVPWQIRTRVITAVWWHLC